MINLEIKCILEEEWGYLLDHKWYFSKRIEEKLNEHICRYRSILRYFDDSKYVTSIWYDLKHEQFILDEVIEVRCVLKTNNNVDEPDYNSLFVQIVKKLALTPKEDKIWRKNDNKCEPLNIMLVSLDSVSRVSWLNRLPKLSQFMFEIMKFDLLEGFNIIGDGTPGKRFLI